MPEGDAGFDALGVVSPVAHPEVLTVGHSTLCSGVVEKGGGVLKTDGPGRGHPARRVDVAEEDIREGVAEFLATEGEM